MTSSTNTSTHVTTTYTYDYRNRLTQVTTGGTVVATHTYDALNRRIGTDDNGTQTWTVYDGMSPDANPYADFNGSGSLTVRYLFGPTVVNRVVTTGILARTSSGGTTAWYLTDDLGSVRDIVSTSGSELDHIVYDSFGNIVTETNATNGDRFKFAGMQYDATIGQYFDHARWYGAGAGRFMGLDPMGFAAGDANLYPYVFNVPTSATDPSGLLGMPSASDVFDTVLNTIDAFAAGVANFLTGGLSTQMRAEWYGEFATNNHTGTVYFAGNAFALGVSMCANPCTMGAFAQGSFRILTSLQVGSGVINAYQAYQAGDNLGAAMSALTAVMASAQFFRTCFAAGTPILTPEGSKPIEEIRPGHWVLSAPEDGPEAAPEPRLVEETYQTSALVLRLEVGGRIIRTTAEHPFWVRGRGWVQAQSLEPGHELRSHDGSWVAVGRTSPGELVPVYNLRISVYHTYFVGHDEWGFSVWAHNANCLRAAMIAGGTNFRTGEQAAHMIPTGAFTGRQPQIQQIINRAQAFLTRSGIDINDVRNGFVAPPGHFGTHTDMFFQWLGDNLPGTPGSQTAGNFLTSLKTLIEGGQFLP
jgi:RHS repeat-associated protein